MHISFSTSVHIFETGGMVIRDLKIVDDGQLQRLNECHETFHTFEMSPSEL